MQKGIIKSYNLKNKTGKIISNNEVYIMSSSDIIDDNDINENDEVTFKPEESQINNQIEFKVARLIKKCK